MVVGFQHGGVLPDEAGIAAQGDQSFGLHVVEEFDGVVVGDAPEGRIDGFK